LPKNINSHLLIQNLSPLKDVDCLHYLNIGLLFQGSYFSITPCTPNGCLTLIKNVHRNLSSLKAVVIGRSNLIGKPMLEVLLKENCTVSILHANTLNPKKIVSISDIVICASGIPHLVDSSWIKKGAIVIDVGIQKTINKYGDDILVGDVNFFDVLDKVNAITPVPGGVGPMTISCLMENTVQLFERFLFNNHLYSRNYK
jgi:methylenetetrahydrofolate dehydrogenase (NADP+)/methenyltetrahydrofolate cyclohydrolase